jgi:U6 snRNA-associated Sm-like protein LSm8
MALNDFKDKMVSVITNDGRNIIGMLRGFDQATNIILEKSHERIFSQEQGVVQNVLGLYMVRGDNISIIGELDVEADVARDLTKVRADALKPVRWE